MFFFASLLLLLLLKNNFTQERGIYEHIYKYVSIFHISFVRIYVCLHLYIFMQNFFLDSRKINKENNPRPFSTRIEICTRILIISDQKT